ncbi:polynucleotide adenylyltransferase [Ameyamaea chiangmaiensis NBRC 103196]|uniref:CCA tRNA nucleotidyltransferase n=1 Tax=Ameyamaea chiangmaiensis TaxID=442969 RepID=A0A850PJ81_9PROT|nr:CCA tRNA nucleotidyltransferase [Ameyamaea chiangmaiensis]MBS4075404.1 CCA tRNA nucleotidyltransferase [Ameyamaea chiangmaiensis]NVN41341.1 CCA tRNA nucleotidyltransferase [Ameyamaea chiangmaiensis]GBQ69872.1 polynucleotide adenylyltransferase [Ameyamaea chiangmaiensis NBRC 103196]
MTSDLTGALSDPSLRKLWDRLPRARLVGGVVRDLLIGRDVADIDLATPEPPDVVQHTLADAGIKVVPTGIGHGTVTAVIDGRPFEITTLRRDVETDGRHATVAWTSDWRADAARRDFTFNAMFCDREGVVFDYFGGREDLLAGRVRFVGDPDQRLAEDALRLLRYFRFLGRFGREEPDLLTLAAIKRAVPRLARLSVERVWSELSRILGGPRASEMSALMGRLGVLDALLPGERTQGRLERTVSCGAPADPVLRLGALTTASADVLGQRLRLARREVDRLNALRTLPPVTPTLGCDDRRRLLASFPPAAVVARSWLAQGDVVGAPDPEWDRLRGWILDCPVPMLPVAGRDVVAAGVAAGPAVGAVLQDVGARWRAGGCVADRRTCLVWIREAVAARPS